MSISSVAVIVYRITHAERHSKIAVFKCGDKFDAVFEQTAATTQRLHVDDDYLGSFYGNGGAKEFKKMVDSINK